ncbi:cation transporter [Paremcibacter congregatus]|uniref:Cation transporter n=1 Tax=Paremcibacter congregatus TaxID=2043170 RepID=A0A2G4YRM8_9PROT|nr:cation transporter [Paremcibacter congregatus]PHZ84920.1 cation transporter [Paremcibacter congregatus]QDE26106.1 cation transporter [Paremcibacter congregatus]
MSGCCDHDDIDKADLQIKSFRRALWAVLLINGVMFVMEFSSAFFAGSVSLQADALDFLGDTVTYAITLLAMGYSLQTRARVALFKGLSLGVLGLWVYGQALYYILTDQIPSYEIMGLMGVIAFFANLGSALLLYRYRVGDSNMQSVWLCSRNDAIGNLAIIVAASGVFATGSAWPDFAVATVMATLAVTASLRIIRLSLREMRAEVHEHP